MASPKATVRIEIEVHDLGDLQRVTEICSGVADVVPDPDPSSAVEEPKPRRKKTTRKKAEPQDDGLSKEDVAKAVNAAVKKLGVAPVRKVFEYYDAKIVDDIKSKDYAAFIAALNEADDEDAGFGV